VNVTTSTQTPGRRCFLTNAFYPFLSRPPVYRGTFRLPACLSVFVNLSVCMHVVVFCFNLYIVTTHTHKPGRRYFRTKCFLPYSIKSPCLPKVLNSSRTYTHTHTNWSCGFQVSKQQHRLSSKDAIVQLLYKLSSFS
jgi:hypothetical protein